ncbi:MAG TPA: type II secretion system major pseudopilin GspG [Gammaproteobacteria bacterium]|nr:type II secretion system major pseudopilin GspG [Gammaproteobacteria bacterium]
MRSKPGRRRTTIRQRGFTLLEIMVVVVILGILATFVVQNLASAPEKARITKAKSDIRTLESALERYKLDNYRYPTTEQGLKALVTRPTSAPEPANWQQGGYIKSVPKDPWGNPYQYLGPQDNDGRPQISTLGADNRPGGEGADQDISSETVDQ